MKINEWTMYEMMNALSRCQLMDLKGPVRYAITRNLQSLRPLMAATLEAFPEPTEPAEREAWAKTLEGREVEFQPFMIPAAPDVDDRLFVIEQKKQRDAAADGASEKARTDEQIEFSRILRNQMIVDAIIPLIKDA